MLKIQIPLVMFFIPLFLFGQFLNVQINAEQNDPEEMTIAVNPLNPDNLIAGANINIYYISTDGGYSWAEGALTSQYGVYGDPCVIFDSLGNAFYAHLSNPIEGEWLDRIVVQKSTDGGQTWNTGAGVGLNGSKDQDKEWLAADMTNSPYKHNIYMCWTEFDEYGSYRVSDSTRILFSKSTDNGVSWSAPLKIGDSGGDCLDGNETVEGAVPAIGPEGQIYTSWSGPKGIMFDKSLDGGQTFGKDIPVANQLGGWAFDIPGIDRCNGMPVTMCDISASAYRGTIYIVWSDQSNGDDDTDIFISKSQDNGETWSTPLRVNNDAGKVHQFLPWAAVDPINGNIYVVFYDRRNHLGNETDVYLARSSDGGQSFTNYKISNSPFIPKSQIFFGDYINIAVRDGKIYPIWMRLDDTVLSAWTAIIEESSLAIEEHAFPPDGFALYQNYPNPFNPTTAISYRLSVM